MVDRYDLKFIFNLRNHDAANKNRVFVNVFVIACYYLCYMVNSYIKNSIIFSLTYYKLAF